MEPRVLFRTHYQVDEPAFAERVVARCTSPVESTYDATVAERLARDVQACGKSFNVAAARYAVDLARGLSVLNTNNVWGENGHLINLVARVGDGPWNTELPLTSEEKLLHFRLFLEADGAALLFLARLLLAERQLPPEESHWNELARQMFVQVYSEYLAVTSPTADRVSLRTEIDRLKARGYTGKSGAHKVFLHLQTLYRLDLLDRVSASSERQYRLSEEGAARLVRLLNEIPDIRALEEVVREHRYVEVAARVYDLASESRALSPRGALTYLLPAYRRVVATGVAICPLAPIIEATQISLLVGGTRSVGYSELLDLLKQEQANRVREIRFHQDRRGRPAFLKISDELVRDLAPEGAPCD